MQKAMGSWKAAEDSKKAWNALKRAAKKNNIDVYRYTLQALNGTAVITIGYAKNVEETKQLNETREQLMSLPQFAAINAVRIEKTTELETWACGTVALTRIRFVF